jgi:hypothetical protein
MDLKEFLRHQWDRVGAWIAIGLGGLFLLLGWLGVSDTVFPAEQLPYIISGGLVGACFVGIGAMLWLSADLRDEWTELHEIARHLEQADAPPAAAVDETEVLAAEPVAAGDGAAPEPVEASNGRRPRRASAARRH